MSSKLQGKYKAVQDHTDPHRTTILIYLVSVPGGVGELSSSYLSDYLYYPSNYNAEYYQRWHKFPASLPPAFDSLSCHRTKIFRKPARLHKNFCNLFSLNSRMKKHEFLANFNFKCSLMVKPGFCKFCIRLAKTNFKNYRQARNAYRVV